MRYVVLLCQPTWICPRDFPVLRTRFYWFAKWKRWIWQRHADRGRMDMVYRVEEDRG